MAKSFYQTLVEIDSFQWHCTNCSGNIHLSTSFRKRKALTVQPAYRKVYSSSVDSKLSLPNAKRMNILQEHSYAYTQEELEFEIVSSCNTGLFLKKTVT